MTLTVIRDPLSGLSFTAIASARMYIYAETTGTLTLTAPYAPQEIQYDGFAQDWQTADRSGSTPLLLRKGQPLKTIKFSLTFANPNPFTVQTGQFAALTALAATSERVLVRYGPNEAGLWRITACSMTSVRRHPDTNEITNMTASVTMTQASDAAPAVGPITPPAPPAPPPPSSWPAPRSYVVVRGDCLWNIAKRYYGSGPLWPRIFDANRTIIKNPNLIFPGQRFVIP
jgi:nucleoid-associated protein YgaU